MVTPAAIGGLVLVSFLGSFFLAESIGDKELEEIYSSDGFGGHPFLGPIAIYLSSSLGGAGATYCGSVMAPKKKRATSLVLAGVVSGLCGLVLFVICLVIYFGHSQDVPIRWERVARAVTSLLGVIAGAFSAVRMVRDDLLTGDLEENL